MKLFFSKGACSLAVRIAIHELGLKSQFESVDLKSKKTEGGQDYFKINHKGGVPAIQLDSGEIITENAVIQQYLADQKPGNSVLPLSGMIRYQVLEWMNYIATDLHKGGCGPLFNPAIPEALKGEVFALNLKTRFDFVSLQLGDRHFLVGDQFTLPDGYLFVVLFWVKNFEKFGIHLRDWPNLVRYFEALKKRPSIMKSLQEEGLIAA